MENYAEFMKRLGLPEPMPLPPGYLAGCQRRPVSKNPFPPDSPEGLEWLEDHRAGGESAELNAVLAEASQRMLETDPVQRKLYEKIQAFMAELDAQSPLPDSSKEPRL